MINGVFSRLAIALGVSAVLIALLLLLLGESGKAINLARIIETLTQIPVWVVGFYVSLQVIGAGFRAQRFLLLIRAATDESVPGFFHLYLVTLVRNMTVDLLPARLGELVYVAMLNRGYQVNLSACVSSLAVSLWLDLVVLIPIVAAMVLIPWLHGGQSSGVLLLATALFVLTIFGFVVLRYGLTQLPRLFLSAGGVRAKIRHLLDSLADALNRTFEQGVLLPCLLLSVGVRICKYLGLIILFGGVVSQLPAFADIQSSTILAFLIAGEAGASLPVPTFMGFGIYEAAGSLSLTALGYPAVDSVLASLSLHIASQFVDYSIGGAAAVAFIVLGTRGQPRAAHGGGRMRTILASVLVILGTYLLYAGYTKYQRGHALIPPPAGEAVLDPERRRQTLQSVATIRGAVTWSSNRFGNHDILYMTLPGMTISRLTNHPHTEYFPRFSPDGRKIVFARSHRPWVSQRDPVPWDVILLDLDTGTETKLAAFANTPTWSLDGRYVYFQRNIGSVVRIDVATGAEQLLHQSGHQSIPPDVELQTPSVHQESGLAVTFRRGQRSTALISPINEVTTVGGGCQLTWAPDGSFLYWVDKGGHLGNSIYRRLDGRRQRWLDLPLPYSHEYFPRLSPDGRYLALAASTGGHEHDSADYELFLWDTGTPADAAIRLTFHTGNDNWPDIYAGAE